MTSTIPTGTTPAGWYPDPSTAGQQRYWDGQAWTEHRAPATRQAAPVQQYQPQYAGYTPAPNKSGRALMWVAIAVGVLLLIFVIAAVAGGGNSANTTSDTTTRGTAATHHHGNKGSHKAAPQPATQPDNTTKGAPGPLTWGNWQVVGPLTPKADMISDYSLKFRVKNTGEAQDEGWFTVTMLKGPRILGTMDCTTSSVGPGQAATADCTSMDDFVPGWT